MLDNLKNPPEPFADVIRTHFRLKARSIMAQIDEWLGMDDRKAIVNDGALSVKASVTGSSGSQFQRECEELKKLLMQLQIENSSGPSTS